MLSASFAQSRSIIEGVLLNFSGIAEQVLYLDDLNSFFKMEPRIRSKCNALSPPVVIQKGLEFRNLHPGHQQTYGIRPQDHSQVPADTGDGAWLWAAIASA